MRDLIKRSFLYIVLMLTGCVSFMTNEGLVKVNEKYPYPSVEAEVSDNCFWLLNFNIKDFEYEYYGIYNPSIGMEYDAGSGQRRVLEIDTDSSVLDKLYAACEACEDEYPEKSNKYKNIILEVKNLRQKRDDEERKKQIKQKEAEQRLKKSIEKARQKRENMSKQYGYQWCNQRYLFFTQNKCMEEVNGNFFEVLQQTSDGTLVSFIKSPDYIFLISKNSKDASVADGYPIYDGLFAVDGTYQYTSILGTIKTVKRLKRLK